MLALLLLSPPHPHPFHCLPLLLGHEQQVQRYYQLYLRHR
jgi:hypothetical protein